MLQVRLFLQRATRDLNHDRDHPFRMSLIELIQSSEIRLVRGFVKYVPAVV